MVSDSKTFIYKKNNFLVSTFVIKIENTPTKVFIRTGKNEFVFVKQKLDEDNTNSTFN